MRTKVYVLVAMLVPLVLLAACGRKQAEVPAAADAAARQALIAEALSAAPPSLAAKATVADWDGKVLREGSGGYTCLPTPPSMAAGTSPMCVDGPWMAWANAWGSKTDVKADGVGIAYMLAGDGGASNIDPFATAETAENEWVVSGPHVMIISPEAALLDALPTDFENGGPYVMWKGTPYAHVMVPVDLKGPGGADDAVADALSAATAEMAADAKVVDWEGDVLKDGDGPYTCLPTPPLFADGRAPMCMDAAWMAWAGAWMNKEDVDIHGIGISYMLAGDEGGSNVDPFANEPTDDNEWVVSGPHLMLIVPDIALLAGLPTNPDSGGPYVMWTGTPYAHVMVPVAD